MNTAEAESDSLVAALSRARIPAANHEFIRRFTEAVRIIDFHAVERSDKPYVLATRGDGLPDLHIYHGYTNGFTTEEEIDRVVGRHAGRAPSSRKGTWYVAHPETRVRIGSKKSQDVRREAEICPRCFVQLSLTGVCGNCD